MFLDQLSERLPRLENARARGDLEAVERIAHSLKGSAATVGATRVSELCSGICERARAGDPDEPLEAALVEASGQTKRGHAPLCGGAGHAGVSGWFSRRCGCPGGR